MTTQKRLYELLDYEQLTELEVGYENPNVIFIAVDMLGWPEAKRMSLSEIISSIADSNGKYYLNDGVPYIDEQDVLDNFPIEFRKPYTTVNIAGVEYWFEPDLVTLSQKFPASAIPDASLALTKLVNFPSGTVLYRRTTGVGPMEATTLAQLRADLNIPVNYAKQVVFTVKFNATGSVTDRCAGVIDREVGTADFVFTPGVNDIDLVVTHNLGRRLVSATVFSVEAYGERELVPYKNAYTGVVNALDKNSATIESLSRIGKSVVLNMIFS